VEHSDAIYTRNLGGQVSDHTRNESSTRPRAFGQGNGSWSSPDEERFYTQPGHPLDARNRHPKPARGAWTLADTADSYRSRQSAAYAMETESPADAPTFGMPSSLPYTEEETRFVEARSGSWSLVDARQTARELRDTIRTLEASAEFNPRQTEEPLEFARLDLAAAEREVAVIESISAKWRAAGGVGSVDNGLP